MSDILISFILRDELIYTWSHSETYYSVEMKLNIKLISILNAVYLCFLFLTFSDYKTVISCIVILWHNVQYGVVQISKEKKIKIIIPLKEG